MGPFSGILGKVLPVVGVISLIVAAVHILRDNLDKVREVVERVFGKAGLDVFNGIVDAITNIGETIRNIFTDGNLGGARPVSYTHLFVLKSPLEMIVYPDSTAPYYLGEMMTKWTMPIIESEVQQIWQ